VAELLSSLAGPIVLETKRGQDFTGEIESSEDDTIVLAAKIGGGEVIYSFGIDEILRVRLPGNELKSIALEAVEEGEIELALNLIDQLYEQRQPLFPLLPASEVRYFVEAIPLYRQGARLEDAYRRIEALREKVESADLVRILDTEALLLAHQLGLTDEVRRRAEVWIASEGREVQSALGSCLLARQQIEEGKADEAFLSLLHPITFSRGRRVQYLEHCYEMAIRLAQFLEQAESASALNLEFERLEGPRPLQWTDFSPPDYNQLSLPRPNS
jgi:hypothetical protein